MKKDIKKEDEKANCKQKWVKGEKMQRKKILKERVKKDVEKTG